MVSVAFVRLGWEELEGNHRSPARAPGGIDVTNELHEPPTCANSGEKPSPERRLAGYLARTTSLREECEAAKPIAIRLALGKN
jgi:hypothetical protein